MMPNCLQYPVCIFGILRAGCTVVNVNPLYTARELEHQLKDSGAEAIVILENFAHVLQEVLGKTSVKHVVVAALGDMLGPKGLLVNFVLRNVKKMVPAYELPDAQRFKAMVAEGERDRCEPSRWDMRILLSFSTPGAPPAYPRAPCLFTAISSPTWSRPLRGFRRSSATSPRSSSRRCPFITYSR